MNTILKSANKIIKYLEKYTFPDFDLAREIRWFIKKSPDAIYDAGSSFIAESGKNFGPLNILAYDASIDYATMFYLNGAPYEGLSNSLTGINTTPEIQDGIYLQPRLAGCRIKFTPFDTPVGSTDDEFRINLYSFSNLIYDTNYPPYSYYTFGSPDQIVDFKIGECLYNSEFGYYYYDFQIGNSFQTALNTVYSYNSNSNTIDTLVPLWAAIRLDCVSMNTEFSTWNTQTVYNFV